MPLIWKNLLYKFLKIFFISLASVSSVTLLSQGYEIAQFIALGAKISDILLFTWIQITLLSPFSVALSTTIAASDVASKLCQFHELDALRAAGLSISRILKPIFYLSLLITSFVFCTTFYFIPSIKRINSEFKNHVIKENIVSTLKNHRLNHLSNFWIKEINNNNDFLIFYKNADGRLSLVELDNLKSSKTDLLSKTLRLITYQHHQGNFFPFTNYSKNFVLPKKFTSHLFVENKKPSYIVNQKVILKEFMNFCKQTQMQTEKLLKLKFELIRRIFLSISPCVLLIPSLVFSINNHRRKSIVNRLKIVIFFMTYFLIYTSLGSLKLDPLPLVGFLISFITMIIVCSYFQMNRIERGMT